MRTRTRMRGPSDGHDQVRRDLHACLATAAAATTTANNFAWCCYKRGDAPRSRK